MSDSLKDQLMALGFAPRPPEHKPKVQRKARPAPAKKKQDGADISLHQAYRIRNQQERQQKEQTAARKRELERERRQINQKIKTLVKANAIRDEAADVKRNFLYKGRIRSVLVSKDQIREINDGSLAVVYLSGNYHLLPSAVVEEVRKFAADHVPDLGGTEREDENEYPVPDDLIW